jgi:chromosome segregation ATPase
VELSGKVSALEAEKKILRERISSLEDENKELRRDFSQAMMETASIARSTNDDRLSVASVVRIGQDEEGILRQVVDELKAEVAAWAHEQTTPVASSTSTLLSDIDMNFSSNDMDAPHTLAKALQAQVELIKEQKQITKQAEGLKRDLLLMEARNAELENQLAKERSQVVTPVDQSIMLDLSRAQEESNFLGRQLGNVQDKLDHVREELEEERKKSMSIDSVWRSETALHLRTIRSLEAKLETASQSLAMTSHNSMNGHNSGGLDMHVMTVEQDILNVKATLMTFKKELEAILSKEVYDPKWMPASDGDTQLVSLVATFLSRMRKQYGTLNFHVEKTIAQFCDRLEHLTETVGFLRSSLLFESASVSTATSPVHPPGDITSLASSPSKSRDNGELEFQEDDDDEDDMYSRMEEAREQCPSQSRHLEDVSTDFDDLSRLLSDDSTLDSILKSGATSDYENLRKPLESAIRECQRVRERSAALKEELNSEKIAFAQLESENRRLVREYSQKEEERQLVREALDEAKTKIQQLEALLEQEKMKNEEKLMLLESRCENLETEKVHLEEWLSDSTTKREETLDRMASVQSDLDDVRDELRMAQSSLAETEEAFASLKTRFGEVEGRAFEAEDLVLESRVSQEDMRKERALLKAQMAKSESQAKLLRENLDRVTSQSKKQFDDMSQTIDGLRAEQEESREILRRLVSVYRDICDQFDRSEYVKVSSLGDGADGQFGINWTRVEQLAPFVASMLTDMNARQSELGLLRGELDRVQKDFMLSTDLGTQYKSQIEQEKTQNQKLFELLQQAEIEMERSASQIRELSAALTKQQQQETEVLSKTRVTEQERDTLRSDLSDLRRELSADLRQSKQKINELTHELSGKRKTEEEMRSAIDSLESKGARLRQYVKKLTIKCEEWEMSYERQSKSLEKLQLKNVRMKEKIYEMAAKYKDLYGRVKSKNRVSLPADVS